MVNKNLDAKAFARFASKYPEFINKLFNILADDFIDTSSESDMLFELKEVVGGILREAFDKEDQAVCVEASRFLGSVRGAGSLFAGIGSDIAGDLQKIDSRTVMLIESHFISTILQWYRYAMMTTWDIFYFKKKQHEVVGPKSPSEKQEKILKRILTELGLEDPAVRKIHESNLPTPRVCLPGDHGRFGLAYFLVKPECKLTYTYQFPEALVQYYHYHEAENGYKMAQDINSEGGNCYDIWVMERHIDPQQLYAGAEVSWQDMSDEERKQYSGFKRWLQINGWVDIG